MFTYNHTFYEYFKFANQTKPHYEYHDVLLRFVKTDTCSYVHNLPTEKRCSFVRQQEDCKIYEQFLSYLDFIYCGVEKTDSYLVRVVSILFLTLFGFYLIQITGIATSIFFVPCLNYIGKKFRMSESLVGATILGIANSAAGLFSEFSDMEANTTTLFNTSYGIAIFLQTVVAGLILVIQPFHIYAPTFVRDSVFLLTLIAYIEYLMGDETVNAFESSFLFVYYSLFLVTVAIDTILIKRLSRVVRRKLRLLREGAANEKLKQELEILESEGVMEILMKDSKSVVDPHTTRSAFFVGERANTHIFRQFFESINPIDKVEWDMSTGIQKFLHIVKAPFYLFSLLICPRVDYTLRNHGWSKLLNMTQLISFPLLIVIMTDNLTSTVNGFPVFGLIMIIAAPLILATFFTSRTDNPPIYHLAFAFYAVAVSAILVRTCAIEVGSLTYSITIISKMSPSFIDLTINTWGGALGSIFTSAMLALRGYPRMAFASCYGSPLFSIPVKFGVRLFYRSVRSKNLVAVANRGHFAITLTTFTMGTVFASVVAEACIKFKGRKSLGILRIIIYVIFVLYITLTEFEITHGHSTDHHDQRVKVN